MSENNKSPTEQSTRPLGNTPMKPSALERGIGENVAAKLKTVNPEARRLFPDLLERKRTQSGHARD